MSKSISFVSYEYGPISTKRHKSIRKSALRNKPYEKTLECTMFFSWRYRIMRGDLIKVFRIFDKLEDVKFQPIITLIKAGLHNNGLKLSRNGVLKELLLEKGTGS